MSANPLTQQILDSMAQCDREQPWPEDVRTFFRSIAEALAEKLPDLDPAVLGEVLMHAGLIFRDHAMAKRLDRASATYTTYTANALVGAGGHLYNNARRDEL